MQRIDSGPSPSSSSSASSSGNGSLEGLQQRLEGAITALQEGLVERDTEVCTPLSTALVDAWPLNLKQG
jgi:hypothetical protein